MGDEIKTKITVDADEALRNLGKMSDAMEENEQAIDAAGDASQRTSNQVREHTDAVDKQTRSTKEQADAQTEGNKIMGLAKSQLAGIAAAFVGADGIIQVYDNWIERIEKASERLQENARIVRENAEARLDLVALQGVETIDQVNSINTAAAFAGRRPGEVAQVGTFLTSALPGADADEINQLTLAVASAGRTSTAPLPQIAAGILPIYKQTNNARVASNIFTEGVRQAGETDVGQFGQVLGENIALIQANAGVDVGEAAGLISAATGAGISSRPALTALSNVNFAIRGQGTPEGNKIFERLGITERSNVMSVLEQLVAANERGNLSTADLEALGGREAAGLFATLADRETFERFQQSVNAVDAAEDYTGDLAREKAVGIFSSSPIQEFNILSKSFESESEALRAGDRRAARADTFRQGLTALLDAELAKPDGGPRNITPDLAERIQAEYDFQLGRGLEPEEAVRIAERVPRAQAVIPWFGIDRNSEGEQLQFNGLSTSQSVTAERRRRNGYFSDPLEVIVAEGVPEGPRAIAPHAEVIRQLIRDEIAAEFGRDVQGEALTPRGQERLDDARDRAIDPLLPEPQSAAPRILNHGTMIINGGDPMFDDLDGRDRLA